MSIERKKHGVDFTKSIKAELLDIKKIVSQNQHEITELRGFAKRMESFVFWMKIKWFIKVALIAIPIVLAYFFVLPRVRSWFDSIQELFKNFIV